MDVAPISDQGQTLSYPRGKVLGIVDTQGQFDRMAETVKEELQKVFNPEFLNRLDDVIVFHPLGREHIGEIVKILLKEVQRRLGLVWGVSSRLVHKVETTDEMIEEVEDTLLGDGTVRNNDVIVIISGAPMWVTGTTNLLKLHRVGDRR